MSSKFWDSFRQELEKAAADKPGLISRAIGKAKSARKLGTAALLATLLYGGYQAAKGVTEAHSELQREGQI